MGGPWGQGDMSGVLVTLWAKFVKVFVHSFHTQRLQGSRQNTSCWVWSGNSIVSGRGPLSEKGDGSTDEARRFLAQLEPAEIKVTLAAGVCSWS